MKEEDLDLDFDLSLFQCSSASTFEEEDDLDNIPLYGLPSCSLVMPERNEKVQNVFKAAERRMFCCHVILVLQSFLSFVYIMGLPTN